MYALLVPTLVIAGLGIARRVRSWRRGGGTVPLDQPARRIRRVIADVILQGRTLRRPYAGLMHAQIFYGMIILTIATTVVLIDTDFGIPIMRGAFYLYFQSLIVDIFGGLLLTGLGMAAARRWVSRPKLLVHTDEASWILALLCVIGATGFLLEGWRIAVTNDPWGEWSPLGNLVALASDGFLSDDAMRLAHRGTWWFHLVLVFGLIAWAPYTKLLHVVTVPLNVYCSRLEPLGAALPALDFETAETLGVKSLAELTWKDRLDLDACTECGRCTDVCPAHTVGKALSPRDIILDLRALTRTEPDGSPKEGEQAPLILGGGPALTAEAMWECTTCAACMEACPVYIEQMPKIVGVRRFLVMEEAELPPMMQDALQSLETRGHPFRGSRFSRLDWTDGLDLPLDTPPAEADLLLWVGCGGALVERNHAVIRSFARLLAAAGVKFAILGREEKCTGDPARRMGHEFVFESVAKENIELLQDSGVKKIATACPHCLNAFKNEYPRLGGTFEIAHHTEILAELVREGKLAPRRQLPVTVTFHDPCYLGRQNGILDPPRELVQITVKGSTIEMAQSREASFCCGGGGGMSFVDEPAEQRVSLERARQAATTGADVLAVGCPFCMTQLEDGIKGVETKSPMRVRDVAELLWEAVAPESPA